MLSGVCAAIIKVMGKRLRDRPTIGACVEWTAVLCSAECRISVQLKFSGGGVFIIAVDRILSATFPSQATRSEAPNLRDARRTLSCVASRGPRAAPATACRPVTDSVA